MNCPILLGLLVLGITSEIHSAKLPKEWKTCKPDKDQNICLKEAVQEIIPKYLANGNSKFGVTPLDPFKFEKLVINQGDGPVSINLEFKNLFVKGMKNVVIDAVKADWNKYYLEGDVHIGKDGDLLIEGDYKINGKVLVLPISGEGKCNLVLEKTAAKVKIEGEELIKNGEKYMNVKTFTVQLVPKKLKLQFNNLFNGDKALGDNMNLFLNENWSDILKEVSPALNQALAAAFKQVANKIFHKVPLSEIIK